MDYEKLIEFLVDEIYKRIQEENKEGNSLEKKKSIVVIGESNVDFYRKALREFDINPLTSECKDCDILLISKLCIKGLSNIAQGTCTTKSENFALEMLLKGKKVYILEEGIEYRKYKNTAPKVLYNKYIKFEEELLAYGIEVIDDLNKILIGNKEERLASCNEIKCKINENVCLCEEKKQFEGEKNLETSIVEDKFTINLSNKRLVSESDLRKPHISGVRTLIVSKKAIITPLAKDYIRINNLNVVLS
ncbi:TIGR02536 family ethanolamine utilization protein [Clostridium sp. LIBA-8841]|uniref:TIGR02536 family ethanolamine utilization protein n=1 Tax=Clostridium sp. LIBA-8841 TaxID=2987530 RepID=UPI002AC642F2|nr:TIGR02536 family ethanolamine utilization protein [Clostridium sp. LIBA-8841]MDZ5253854.1 TIGR02536 family ethanolamine utilization protein [Clostridium sp. LIBA-8841]